MKLPTFPLIWQHPAQTNGQPERMFAAMQKSGISNTVASEGNPEAAVSHHFGSLSPSCRPDPGGIRPIFAVRRNVFTYRMWKNPPGKGTKGCGPRNSGWPVSLPWRFRHAVTATQSGHCRAAQLAGLQVRLLAVGPRWASLWARLRAYSVTTFPPATASGNDGPCRRGTATAGAQPGHRNLPRGSKNTPTGPQRRGMRLRPAARKRAYVIRIVNQIITCCHDGIAALHMFARGIGAKNEGTVDVQ